MSVPLRRTTVCTAHESRLGVLVVDDSAVARAALRQIIVEDQHFEVLALLSSAAAATKWLAENRADIIILDIQMPGLDGLSALPELLAASQGARVLMVSSLTHHGARVTVRALSLGATDAIAKPVIGPIGREFGTQLLDRMRRLGCVGYPLATPEKVEPLRLAPKKQRPISCLAIGSSTGGLHALSEFFKHLPTDFTAPIILTQHLPCSFIALFAEQIADASGRSVSVAQDGLRLRASTIYIAPGDAHLRCVPARGGAQIILSREPSETRCMPSVDPMFDSLASTFGINGVAVVLTGMGRDGAAGAATIVEQGGAVIVQDEESSAVWGMPGTVARAGHASLVGTPAKLASFVGRCGSLV